MARKPVSKPHVNWEKMLELGKISDSELAKKIGCSRNAVSRARIKRGIPAYVMPATYNWDELPLGKKTDAQIANELGIPYQRVRYRRLERKIPSFIASRQKLVREIPLEVLMEKGNRVKLAKQFGYTKETISRIRVEVDSSRSIQKKIPPETKKKLLEELNTTWCEVLAEKYDVDASMVYYLRVQMGVDGHYKEERVCMCGTKFNAITRVHTCCSNECRTVYNALKVSLGLDKNEEVDTMLFRMALQIRKRLHNALTPKKWSEKTEELLHTDVRELCARYGINRKYAIQQVWRACKKKEGMTNETPQTQSVDDNPRQPNDPAFSGRRKERRDTRSRRANALPDSASESGTQAG